jgi:hypothetical protein
MLYIFVLFIFVNSQFVKFINYVFAMFLYDLNVFDRLVKEFFEIKNHQILMNYWNLITPNFNYESIDFLLYNFKLLIFLLSFEVFNLILVHFN